ncbi:hypothetical protein [Nocardia sp. CNY236]|uniref:hypothetical protein n=1 Tax=Nocardia sp. CNY236 TaxID=1169152 RepID=UPI0004063FBD|nr:hypothetical protein [Nocardia sp. CNY236]
MVEIVLFPDVEELVVGYLTARLTERGDDTLVTRSPPESPPGRMVRVRSAWGEDRGRALSSRFVTIQCTDETPSGAAELTELCFAILRSSWNDPSVPRIRDAVLADRPDDRLPDPDPYVPNYQFTLSILLRGQAQ